METWLIENDEPIDFLDIKSIKNVTSIILLIICLYNNFS